MTIKSKDEIAAALAPVAQELITAAERDATAQLATADQTVARAAAGARSQVDSLVANAHAQAEADAGAAAAAERARGRREARALILAAHREVVAALASSARESASHLAKDPDYPMWRDALAAYATQLLGAGTVVHDDPDGGVVAEAGDRRIDLRLAGFAERALTELGAELGLEPPEVLA